MAWSLKHIGPSTSLFFVNFDFSIFFVFSLKTSNINVDSTRKINDCKNNALKVKRVQNTFENLNSFETTLKMLKKMQIYLKCFFFFWVFVVFCYFWFFSKNLSKNMGQKLGSNNIIQIFVQN